VSREDRAATLRFGTITVVRGSGNVDVDVVTGATLLDLPAYGAARVVGGRCLVLHDGQKTVAIAG
jgi:hypothetical protein